MRDRRRCRLPRHPKAPVSARSMSGKAKKAREYGVRVIAEPVFWRLVGVDVD